MTLPETAFPYQRGAAAARAASIRVRDEPRHTEHAHTHSGIKISIGQAFFSLTEAPWADRGRGPFMVVRYSTKAARVNADGDISVAKPLRS